MSKREQVAVRLETELREKLQARADQDRRPLARLIRKILHDATQAPHTGPQHERRLERPRDIALSPPAPTAKAVRAHRRTLEFSLDALKAGAADLARHRPWRHHRVRRPGGARREDQGNRV